MSSYYSKGIYTPKHPEKYKGRHPIVYRSAPEKRLMLFADNNSNIIYWQSESVPIPYIKPTDGKLHRYYIDFTFFLKEKDGSISKYLIEYKPFKQTQLPIKGKKSDRSFLIEQLDYAVNQAKWKAGREFARSNGMKFVVLTEKDLEPLL
jgi:hypothetical protein